MVCNNVQVSKQHPHEPNTRHNIPRNITLPLLPCLPPIVHPINIIICCMHRMYILHPLTATSLYIVFVWRRGLVLQQRLTSRLKESHSIWKSSLGQNTCKQHCGLVGHLFILQCIFLYYTVYISIMHSNPSRGLISKNKHLCKRRGICVC